MMPNLGGERSGGKRGRGSPGKTPFVAAVETTPEGKPICLKLRRVTSFCGRAISGFARRSLAPNREVISDGLACFAAVAEAGCHHEAIKTGSDATAARTPAFNRHSPDGRAIRPLGHERIGGPAAIATATVPG